jgi:hypothetical protein
MWGGPIAIFRWDSINDIDVIDPVVRETNLFSTERRQSNEVGLYNIED